MHGHPDKSIYGTHRENLMSVAGFITGLTALLLLLLTIIPSLGWMNWLNIALAVIGLAFSLIGAIYSTSRWFGIAGIIICCAVIIFGALHLKAFGGII